LIIHTTHIATTKATRSKQYKYSFVMNKTIVARINKVVLTYTFKLSESLIIRNITVKDKNKKLSRKPSVVHKKTLGTKKTPEIHVVVLTPRSLNGGADLKSA